MPSVASNPLDNLPPPGRASFGKAGTPSTAESLAPQQVGTMAGRQTEPVAVHRPSVGVLPAGIAIVVVLVGGATATLRRYFGKPQ